MGIFISRLLPVVRHLIGIPAGIVRMDYRSFRSTRCSARRSGARCSAGVGVKMGEDLQKRRRGTATLSLWSAEAMVGWAALLLLRPPAHEGGKVNQKTGSARRSCSTLCTGVAYGSVRCAFTEILVAALSQNSFPGDKQVRVFRRERNRPARSPIAPRVLASGNKVVPAGSQRDTSGPTIISFAF